MRRKNDSIKEIIAAIIIVAVFVIVGTLDSDLNPKQTEIKNESNLNYFGSYAKYMRPLG